MTDTVDMTIQILREIRDQIVLTRTDLGGRIDETNARVETLRTDLGGRIDQTNVRLDDVEQTLLELAEQQRFVVRHLDALTTRDRKIETDVESLRVRLDVVEKKLAST